MRKVIRSPRGLVSIEPGTMAGVLGGRAEKPSDVGAIGSAS
jgi:hypothetical protein